MLLPHLPWLRRPQEIRKTIEDEGIARYNQRQVQPQGQ